MKSIFARALVMLLAAILALNVVGCGNEVDDTKKETQNKVQPSEKNTVKDPTEGTDDATDDVTENVTDDSTENTTGDENEEDAPTDGALVYENFVSGVIVDEPEVNQLKLEITSIDLSDNGLEIHYNAERHANDSYSNYYTFSRVVLDGCVVEGEYYTDDKRHDSMGKHKGEADGDTYYLIPNIVLNAMGFDGSWTKLEITFWAGYSAYNTTTEEFRQEFVLYSGAKAELAVHELPETAAIGTIYADDEVQFVVTGVEMFTGNLGKFSGQNVYVYTKTSGTRWKAWMTVTVGDKFVVAEETVFVEVGDPCVQRVEFRQSNVQKFNYQEADMSAAVWKITLVNMETGESTEYQVPIDLSVK